MSLADDYLQEIRAITTEIKDLSDVALSITGYILDISPLDFQALFIQNKVGETNGCVSKLKVRVKKLQEEFHRLSQQGFFTQSQLNDIGERWNLMIAKAQTLSELVKESEAVLKGRNLWVALVSVFNDLVRSVEDLVFQMAKPIIDGVQNLLQGVKATLSLPPWS